MQIRQLLQYFDAKTKITVASYDSETHKYSEVLIDRTIEDIRKLESYYNSILDKTINPDTLTIIDGVLNISVAN